MPEALIGARAVHFASTAMVFGVTLFRFQIAEAAFRQARASVLAVKTNYLRELSWVFWISFALAVLSAAMWLVLLAANISNEPIPVAVSDGTLWTVLTQTQIGFVWIVRLILAALLASWLLFVNPDDKGAFRSGWLPIFCAASFMGSLAWSGHAGGTPGMDGDVHVASDFLHLIAAGAWLGGLLPLTLLLASARYAQDQSMPVLLRAATFRFSTVGLFAVGTLFATGIVNAAILVGSFSALLETNYGNLLLAKIGLFAVMVSVATINRLHLRPRLPNADAIRQLARNTWIETGLGLSIIVIVSVLGILPPAAHMNLHNHVHIPSGSTSSDVAFVHIHSNRGMAEVTIAPDHPGVARASIRLMNDDLSPLAANDVTLVLTPQAPTSTPPISRAATHLSDGTWEVVELKIARSGVWVVKLTVKTDAGEPFILDAPIVIER
jgi:putative copper resistance protein D